MVGRKRKAKLSKELSSLNKEINRIGSRMVGCRLKCGGIINNPKKGLPPRGLVLEWSYSQEKSIKNAKKLGVIVIGMNPGDAQQNPKEQEYYKNKQKKNKLNFEAEKKYIFNNIIYHTNPKTGKLVETVKYYGQTKTFIRSADPLFRGAILWTELCKCQNKKKRRLPFLQTFITCIRKHLVNEISTTPANVPIIALGVDAFKYTSIAFPSRFVVGIPHPASYGLFSKLFYKNNKEILKDKYKKELKETKDKYGNPKAIKLVLK